MLILDLKIRPFLYIPYTYYRTIVAFKQCFFVFTRANICSKPNYSFCSKLALTVKRVMCKNKNLCSIVPKLFDCFTDWKMLFIELLNIYCSTLKAHNNYRILTFLSVQSQNELVTLYNTKLSCININRLMLISE